MPQILGWWGVHQVKKETEYDSTLPDATTRLTPDKVSTKHF